MLLCADMTGRKIDKVQMAVDRLRAFEPPEGYWVAFSGGKDSQCIYHLCIRAGVKFDAHYSVTSVDPPELVRFIKRQYPEGSIDIPHDKSGKPITMWSLIVKKRMPPTRLVRYCCKKLKEGGGKGRVVVTGVRWAESVRRKKNHGIVTVQGSRGRARAQENGAHFAQTVQGGITLNYDDSATRRTVEQCYRTNKVMVNPIADWEDEDVWEYLNEVEKVPHCELYDRGYERLGCIGCPMATRAEQELEAYPKYRDNYLRAFERMIEARREAELRNDGFTSPQAVMDWWLGKRTKGAGEVEGQMDMWEEYDA